MPLARKVHSETLEATNAPYNFNDCSRDVIASNLFSASNNPNTSGVPTKMIVSGSVEEGKRFPVIERRRDGEEGQKPPGGNKNGSARKATAPVSISSF